MQPLAHCAECRRKIADKVDPAFDFRPRQTIVIAAELVVYLEAGPAMSNRCVDCSFDRMLPLPCSAPQRRCGDATARNNLYLRRTGHRRREVRRPTEAATTRVEHAWVWRWYIQGECPVILNEIASVIRLQCRYSSPVGGQPF